LSSGSALIKGALSEASERIAHYRGRSKDVAGEWHLNLYAEQRTVGDLFGRERK